MKLVFTVLIFILAGCVAPKLSKAPMVADPFDQTIVAYYAGKPLPEYGPLYSLYLNSTHVQNTGPKYEEFAQILARIESGETPCQTLDWAKITQKNFWSLKPHISAASCFERNNDTARATFYNQTVEYLLKGILASGDGENHYSAYEIATTGDANDVVELMGLKIVDYYAEFGDTRTSLYYTVVAQNPDTGKQQEIHFNTQRFIASVMGYEHPFVGLADGWVTRVLPQLSQNGRTYKVAMAAAVAGDGDLEKASQLYMDAISNESVRAAYLLGTLCLQKDMPGIAKNQCAPLLMEAAEQEYVPALIVLSYLYETGLTVEKNAKTAKQLAELADKRSLPGYVSYQLGKLHEDETFSKKDSKRALEHFRQAAKAGDKEAQFKVLLDDLKQKRITDAEYLKKLRNVAESGSRIAIVVLAEMLHDLFRKGTPEFAESEHWYKKATELFIPATFYKLGLAYENGDYGAKDEWRALKNFEQGAMRFDTKSMLRMGYANDLGRGTREDNAQALRWYMLCADQGDGICATNAGHLFYEEKKYEYALSMFEFGAKKGISRAINYLGLLHLQGFGVTKNYAKAYEFFKQAADKNDQYGNYNIGRMYLNGWGMDKDINKAKEYFEKAKEVVPAAKTELIRLGLLSNKTSS